MTKTKWGYDPLNMLGTPVSGAEPGFPGDPVSPAYPRLGPAAGSWRETRQTRRSPVLRNQVKNEKNTKNEHHATGSGWPCGLVQARSQRQMLLALTRGNFFFTFFCNCRPLHRQLPVRVEVNSKTGRNRVKPGKTGEGTSQ